MDNLQDLVQSVPLDLVAQLIAGAVGGTAAGATLKGFSLGPFWNAIAGLIGGGAGAQALFYLGMMPPGGTDAEALGTQAASGGIGGALLLVILGLIKSMVRR
jgi:hypothetical protein